MKNHIAMRRNICVDMDAYKMSHPLAINQGLEKQYSYGESRVGSKYKKVCFAGLNPIIMDNFLNVPTDEDIQEAAEEAFNTFGYDIFREKNFDGLSSEDIWKKVQKLGYLPIKIKAVPEGTILPVNNVLFTIESTEPWFAKHTNGLETLLMHVWYPTTVSTRFKHIKESIRPLVEQTGTIEMIDFMINDFGARGATTFEAAAMGGMAVLIHGQGSDNMIASRLIKDYYGGYKGRAKSIWATEHSVALSFGPNDGELQYIKHQLENCPINKMLAVVIDTYDSRNFMQNIVGNQEVIDLIKKRSEAGGAIVFRPDSGVPEEQVDMIFDALTSHFGYHLNDKGFKRFNHSVSVIQGDGMNEVSIIELYKYIVKNHWSTDNLAVGSGGGLLQVDINRDTQRFAIKPSYGIIKGKEIMFKKTPKTDTTKTSKSGMLKLHPGIAGGYLTISSALETVEMFGSYADSLVTILENGEFNSEINEFSKIIERAGASL